jgi:V/A-type H+-transporting ATPase subunit C
MIGELRRYAAANARVRSLLPTLLGRSGLESLSTYPSRGAVLDALLRTPYASPVPASPPERGALEHLVSAARAVLRLLPDPERAFLRTYLLHYEIENLKLVIRAVHCREPWGQVAPYILGLPGLATVDPHALAEARDIRDLVERLATTPYGPALRGALHRLREAGPFALEVAVELDYYDRLWAAADTLRPTDAARARHLLGILFDVLNVGWIVRYRDALGLSPEEILNYTLRQGRWVTLEVRRALAGAPGFGDPDHTWEVALARTPYAPLLATAQGPGFDAAASLLWRFLAAESQRMLIGYPFHIGVPLGFLLTQEIEIRDLQIVLAGKSIGVPGPDIVDHLASLRP